MEPLERDWQVVAGGERPDATGLPGHAQEQKQSIAMCSLYAQGLGTQ